MSSNRFKTIKPKLEDQYRKELTPKSTKLVQKYSPIYSSFRGGATLKPQSSSKIKLIRPSTSKHSENQTTNPSFFPSREDKQTYNSTKKIQPLRSSSKRPLQYQPRSKSKSPQKHLDEIIREEIYIIPKKYIPISRDIKTELNNFPSLPKVLPPITNFEAAKHSLKSNGLIRAYAASTNQGPVRDYNEDRVAIILNIAKPQHCQQWRKAAYFGVFDGHGGVDCADYLRDTLHTFVTKQKQFPSHMNEALSSGFSKCESVFLEKSKTNSKVDRSGSCAVVTFFYGEKCYIANVGDSRAIMSSKCGEMVTELSIDHKASDDYEQKRITDSGGKIYQTKLQNANPTVKILYEGEQHDFVMGPHRVLPGRLSVTRTFGDLQAKLPQLGGNPHGIISTPQIRSIMISPEQDFIILASDGIYDKLTNSQIVQMVWETVTRDHGRYRNIHEFCGLAVQNIMKLAFLKKTLDNITVVMIALEGLENYFVKMETNRQTANTTNGQHRKPKIMTKLQSSFQRKYIGRSTSPSNYSTLRSKSFYKN